MKLLDSAQIEQKVRRLAIEILEQNYKEKEIILAGINRNGMHFAEMLQTAIKAVDFVDVKVELTNILLNPANPIEKEIEVATATNVLSDKVVIVVDDVANTGRTMLYALLPLLKTIPKKIELAVLVDRKHKAYPIQPNYVGLSLATTLKEQIDVQIRDVEASERAVYLN